MSKIFISHAHDNNAAAIAIANWLTGLGWGDHFLDIDPGSGIAPGQRWREALQRAAHRCQAVLCLISPAWRDSRWCLAEFLLAQQLGKTVFGVLIEPTALESLPVELTSESQLCNLVSGIERIEFRVHDSLGRLSQVSFSQVGLATLRVGLQRAGLDASTFPWPPPSAPQRRPYPGLRALEADDAAVFFGRDADITRGLDAVRSLCGRGVERMLVVLGPSGTGKSSFLRAGIWPRLIRDDERFLPLPIVRPERGVIHSSTGLVASLYAAFQQRKIQRTRAELRQSLETGAGLRRLISELREADQRTLGSHAASPVALLAIDQAEELFAPEAGAEADQLLQWLAEALAPVDTREASEPSDLIVVVTIRSESYEIFQTHPRLADIRFCPFDLRPMLEAEFKAVIEGPAERETAAGRSLRLEAALTERLLLDAHGADALPLLAFILERLHSEYGAQGHLSLKNYEELGGLRGAIESAIAAALADPDRPPAIPAERRERDRLLREAFIPRMAGVDPRTGERMRRVARWDHMPEAVRPLLERLIDGHVLVRDHRPFSTDSAPATVVEIAHEALLRQWTALASWLDESAADLEQTDAIERAADAWRKLDRNSDLLVHAGSRLETAEALIQRSEYADLVGSIGRDYLAACRLKADRNREEHETHLKRIEEEQERVSLEQKRTARFQRRAAVVLSAMGLVVAVSVTLIVLQTRAVSQETLKSLLAAARAAGTSEQGVRIAVAAVRHGTGSLSEDLVEAQLVRAAFGSRVRVGMKGHTDVVYSAQFGGPEERVITASRDGMARIWNSATGEVLHTLPVGEDTFGAVLSPDGLRAVTVSMSSAKVWNVRSGKADQTLQGLEDGSPLAVAFSSDGRWIATGSVSGGVHVMRADDGRLVRVLPHRDQVVAVGFSLDGRRVASAGWDGTARIWDLDSGELLKVLDGHDLYVVSVAFSPDGKSAVTSAWDGTARIWDLETGNTLQILTGHRDRYVNDAEFSPDGTHVVTAGGDGTALIRSVEDGTLTAVLEHDSNVNSASFSRDGRRILTGSTDGRALIWALDLIEPALELDCPNPGASFSPDGLSIGINCAARKRNGYERTESRIVDANTGREIRKLERRFRAFSPDGRRLVTVSDDGKFWTEDLRGTAPAQAWPVGESAPFAFSRSGRTLVTSAGRIARVWDEGERRLLHVLEHECRVVKVEFSFDERSVMTSSSCSEASVGFPRVGSADPNLAVRIWNAEDGKVLHVLPTRSEDETIVGAEFSADGKFVVGVGAKQTGGLLDSRAALLWDVDSGKLVRVLEEEDEGSLRDLSISPDGRKIAYTATRLVTVWDVESAAVVQRFVPATLASQSSRVIDPLEARLGGSLPISLHFTPDGRRLLVPTSDGFVQVWDIATPALVGAVRVGAPSLITGAELSPDGRLILTHGENEIRVWQVDLLTSLRGDALVDTVCRERLAGTAALTYSDLMRAPVLAGREGESVCEPPTLIGSIADRLRRMLH